MNGKASLAWTSLDLAIVARPATVVRTVRMDSIISAIKTWREQMQENDPDLSRVTLQADLAIFDFCQMVGMSPEETGRALGDDLASDLMELVN